MTDAERLEWIEEAVGKMRPGDWQDTDAGNIYDEEPRIVVTSISIPDSKAICLLRNNADWLISMARQGLELERKLDVAREALRDAIERCPLCDERHPGLMEVDDGDDWHHEPCERCEPWREALAKLDETTYLTASEANRKRLEESREQMEGADDMKGGEE
jgi:hypothetical protein